MKHTIFFLILIIFSFQACEDCTMTELENPEGFDCLELMANIGDNCDDRNPDTENDMVDANCVCVGDPIVSCEGDLLVMRAVVENNMLGNFFLDRAERTPIDLLSFTQLEPIDDPSIQTGEIFPFQFSSLNPIQDTYFYGIQYGGGQLKPLVLSSTNGSFPPAYLPTELPYAAPVHHQGELYAINLVYDEPIVEYTILRINQANGQPTPIFIGSTTVNSQVVNPLAFSVSNGSDKVYFLAGSSLFEYNTDMNVVNHVLLEPEPDPDMPLIYTGLEYRVDTDQLLAMRHQTAGNDIRSTLVSISQEGTFTQNELIDIEGFDFFLDGAVLHSTAYAQCDNKYYITTPVELEQEIFESYLIEIDVSGLNEVQSEVFPEFLFGIEVHEF